MSSDDEDDEDNIRPKRRKKITPRKHLLVEVEADPDGTIKGLKGILPMPPLQKGGASTPEKIRLACENASKAGDKTYENKILMILHFTTKPFKLIPKIIYDSVEENLKMKPDQTERPE